ncbi:MAG: rod shape-determining protein MreD [Gammaproteobacteria bacterium RIFCSPLOWO2_02_FULL_56_15]|nr:MAG: rod shape-determining protein MreD [Gammaproteobacteria bacterium RIFCSPLOWO2_02_FULL_56_15]
MPQSAHSRSWIIALSLLVALMLTAMPLPEWAVNWRPAWVAMVLIYWCMALPDRVGIGISWTLGLLLDVQQGTVLGQNALGLAVIAFITLKSHQRLRVFPLVQQAFLVCGYILLFQIIVLWIKSMLGIPPMHWSYWMPAFSSMLLWPWIFIILRDVRRKFKVQ